MTVRDLDGELQIRYVSSSSARTGAGIRHSTSAAMMISIMTFLFIMTSGALPQLSVTAGGSLLIDFTTDDNENVYKSVRGMTYLSRFFILPAGTKKGQVSRGSEPRAPPL